MLDGRHLPIIIDVISNLTFNVIDTKTIPYEKFILLLKVQ